MAEQTSGGYPYCSIAAKYPLSLRKSVFRVGAYAPRRLKTRYGAFRIIFAPFDPSSYGFLPSPFWYSHHPPLRLPRFWITTLLLYRNLRLLHVTGSGQSHLLLAYFARWHGINAHQRSHKRRQQRRKPTLDKRE
jgi:hypothetical protein